MHKKIQEKLFFLFGFGDKNNILPPEFNTQLSNTRGLNPLQLKLLHYRQKSKNYIEKSHAV